MRCFIAPLATVALPLTFQSFNEDTELFHRTVTSGLTLSAESNYAADAPANSRRFLSIQSYDGKPALHFDEADFQSTSMGFTITLPDLPIEIRVHTT